MRQFWRLPEREVIKMARLLVATAWTGANPRVTMRGTRIVPPPMPRNPARIPARNPPMARPPITQGVMSSSTLSWLQEDIELQNDQLSAIA